MTLHERVVSQLSSPGHSLYFASSSRAGRGSSIKDAKTFDMRWRVLRQQALVPHAIRRIALKSPSRSAENCNPQNSVNLQDQRLAVYREMIWLPTDIPLGAATGIAPEVRVIYDHNSYSQFSTEVCIDSPLSQRPRFKYTPRNTQVTVISRTQRTWD
jgi:hypothetical protein